MPIIRIMSVLGLIMLAGCVGGAPLNAGVAGPTGRAGDAGKIHAITVRDVRWEARPASMTTCGLKGITTPART
jgi:hypothetical protein